VLQKANAWRWLGGAQYKLAAYHSLLKNRGYRCTVEVTKADGTVETVKGKFAMIQGQVTVHMGDRMAFCPQAQLDDGLLDLILIKHGSVGAMIGTMTAAEKTKHMNRKNVQSFQCKAFRVIPDAKDKHKLVGPKSVNVDGELIAAAPFQCTVMPASMLLVASDK
jgi:diacylglycerol kinase (ATP)